jgi:leucyl/phenylalanyl-tRNA--protein transferase
MTFDVRQQQVAFMFSEGTQSEVPSSLADQRRRRCTLFDQRPSQAAAREIFGFCRALSPSHIADLPFLVHFLLRRPHHLTAGLPDPADATRRPDGLCGLVRDLSVTHLMEAYARGLYPKAYAGPFKWWAPAERLVVDPAEAKTPKATRGHLRRRSFAVAFDRDFDAVVAACARSEETLWRPCWMNPQIKHAYADLHDAGFAHSFEVRGEDGKLIAGGFGIAVGRVFVTESTFGKVGHWRDFGLTVLHRHLALWGFAMHDMKAQAPEGFGFAPIARATYQAQLLTLLGGGKLGRWRVDPTMCGPGLPAGRAQEFREALQAIHAA